MNTIGAFVAETAAKAPPLLVEPSILVKIIDPISTARLKATAYSYTA